MILLTDEEIDQLSLELALDYYDGDGNVRVGYMIETSAKAQLKKVVGFMGLYENDLDPALDETHTRFDIPTEKWQSLLEEVKE